MVTPEERIAAALDLCERVDFNDKAPYLANWIVQALAGECKECGGTYLTGHQGLCTTPEAKFDWFRTRKMAARKR